MQATRTSCFPPPWLCRYEEGANLSSREVVLQAACELGLLRDEGEAWLGSPEAQAAVAADDGEAKARHAADGGRSRGWSSGSAAGWPVPVLAAKRHACCLPLFLPLPATQARHHLCAHVPDQQRPQQGGAAGGGGEREGL